MPTIFVISIAKEARSVVEEIKTVTKFIISVIEIMHKPTIFMISIAEEARTVVEEIKTVTKFIISVIEIMPKPTFFMFSIAEEARTVVEEIKNGYKVYHKARKFYAFDSRGSNVVHKFHHSGSLEYRNRGKGDDSDRKVCPIRR